MLNGIIEFNGGRGGLSEGGFQGLILYERDSLLRCLLMNRCHIRGGRTSFWFGRRALNRSTDGDVENFRLCCLRNRS